MQPAGGNDGTGHVRVRAGRQAAPGVQPGTRLPVRSRAGSAMSAGLGGTGRVADDLYLMAHHEVSGRPLLQPRALGTGLAAALLAELMLGGSIVLRPRRRGGRLPCPARRWPGPAGCTTRSPASRSCSRCRSGCCSWPARPRGRSGPPGAVGIPDAGRRRGGRGRRRGGSRRIRTGRSRR